MTKLKLVKYPKILAVLLLPVFLFSIFSYPSSQLNALNGEDLPVIFTLKSLEDLEPVSFAYGMKNAQPVFISPTDASLKPTFKATIDSGIFNRLKNDNRLAYAELDREVSVAAIIPSDPYFTTDSSLEDKQWYLAKIKLAEAWEFAKGNGSITVAIIDTGIHGSHIELNDGRVVGGYNIVKNEAIGTGVDSDDNGHGTAVAGVIGAIANNARGIAGINWTVKLMPIKALEADGTGTISSISSAIVWAADNGASVINLRLGGPGFGNDQTLNNAIIYAFNKGVVIVAAAGNDLSDQGINLDTKPVYPVCSDAGSNMVIGVAATDNLDRKASF